MPLPQRRHPAATLLAMLTVLGGTIALAEYVSKTRVKKLQVEVGVTSKFEDIEYALPDGWTKGTSAWRFDIATATRPPVAPGPVSDDEDGAPDLGRAASGARRISIAVERPREPMTSAMYIAGRFGQNQVGGGSAIATRAVAGRPGREVVIIYGRLGSVEGFRLCAATVLPSGRVLSVRVEGPGEPTETDAKALRATCDALSVAGEPSASADPFQQVRYANASPALEQLRADGNVSGDRLVVRLGAAEVALAIYPVYAPAPGVAAAATHASPGSADPVVDRANAEGVARIYASLYNPALEMAPARWVSPSRLVFAPDGPQDFSARAMVVWATPDARHGSLIVARGTGGSDTLPAFMLSAMNRTADALSFERRPESPTAMVAAGVRLAQQSAGQPARPDLGLLWKRSGTITGWTEVLDASGQLVSHREPTRSESVARASEFVKVNAAGTRRFEQSQYVFNGAAFVQVPNSAVARIGRALTRVPEPNSVGAAMSMGDPATFIPGTRLLQVAPLAGGEPAIVCTDSIPWLQLEGRPPGWFVLISPAAGQTGAWNIHVLGSSMTLRAKYGPENELVSVESVGTGESALAYRDLHEMWVQLPKSGPLAR